MRENGPTDKKILTINIKGNLMNFETPKIMGILNVTPDSFYANSRKQTTKDIETRIKQIIEEGGDIIDIGACSTRPDSSITNYSEERERLEKVFTIIKGLNVDLPISIDTFRSEIARWCVENFQVDIINDVSGGAIDKLMSKTVADLKVPYVLTHSIIDGNNLHSAAIYSEVTADVISSLSKKVNELHSLGVKDIIIDPGFCFSKSLQDNFQLLDNLNEFIIFNSPLLVGLSRKSMVYKTLNTSPEDSLAGSISLEAFALDRGADILRVHDVKATKELVTLYQSLKN